MYYLWIFPFHLKLKRDFLDIQTCLTAFSYLAFSGKSLTGLLLELTIGQCSGCSSNEGSGGRRARQSSLWCGPQAVHIPEPWRLLLKQGCQVWLQVSWQQGKEDTRGDTEMPLLSDPLPQASWGLEVGFCRHCGKCPEDLGSILEESASCLFCSSVLEVEATKRKSC